MKIVKTGIDEVDETIVCDAIRILAKGGVILYPTDTVYGLGANIFNNNAVRRVFNIKQRSFLKPLSILVSDIESVNLVAELSPSQKQTIKKYLPGPCTFILKKKVTVPRYVTGGLVNVGVRVPDNELACRLADIFPITTTSANLSDDEILSNPQEILEQLNCEVDMVIDVGELNFKNPSSIVDLTGFKPKIIRK